LSSLPEPHKPLIELAAKIDKTLQEQSDALTSLEKQVISIQTGNNNIKAETKKLSVDMTDYHRE
jgi:uncharacterized protein YoxC